MALSKAIVQQGDRVHRRQASRRAREPPEGWRRPSYSRCQGEGGEEIPSKGRWAWDWRNAQQIMSKKPPEMQHGSAPGEGHGAGI